MKVRDVCTRNVRTCRRSTSLADAGGLFWTAGCGMLPVVDDDDRLLGVVTDRDVCIALTTRDLPAGTLTVAEVMTERPHTCGLDESLLEAMEAMGRHHVRRLPVVDAEGRVQGVLSIADVVRAARSHTVAEPGAPTFEDLAQMLRAVCSRRGRRRADRRADRLDPFLGLS